ncbi:MAG: hypothetical protein K0S23_3458 [Fluviicola sp.]|jgi:hypothetical protein|uniref:hypothetical protein n=1 Tax=Fluviicola sp. TaxID=1917219 RepID=UPI00261D7F4E|nr:hypothetical protein [Fluviicola sp.]MDF3029151.1 hypothetical protein [Fluviicola sp.]
MENNLILDQASLMSSLDETELNLLFNYFQQEYNDKSIIRKLLKKGYDEPKAIQMIVEARKLYVGYTLKKKAQRDIIFGSLWFIGGIIGTLANIGFIFWGAILFGMMQGVKGITNYKNL